MYYNTTMEHTIEYMETTEALCRQYRKLHTQGVDVSDLFDEIKFRVIRIGYNLLPGHIAKFHYKEDILAELDLHLHLAILAYKSSYKTKFSTYAHYWFKKAIYKYLSNKTRLVRFPEAKAGKIEENIVTRKRKDYDPFKNMIDLKINTTIDIIDIITINRKSERLSQLEFDVIKLHLDGFNFREIKNKLKPKNSIQYIHTVFKEAIQKLK